MRKITMLRHVAAEREAREAARGACDLLAQRLVAARSAPSPDEILLDELGAGCSELDRRIRHLTEGSAEVHRELAKEEEAKGFAFLDRAIAQMQVELIGRAEMNGMDDDGPNGPTLPSRWFGPRVLHAVESAATEELAEVDGDALGVPAPLTDAEQRIADKFDSLVQAFCVAAEESHGLRRVLPRPLGDPYGEDDWYVGLDEAA